MKSGIDTPAPSVAGWLMSEAAATGLSPVTPHKIKQKHRARQRVVKDLVLIV
jgi:hypothetical protein